MSTQIQTTSKPRPRPEPAADPPTVNAAIARTWFTSWDTTQRAPGGHPGRELSITDQEKGPSRLPPPAPPAGPRTRATRTRRARLSASLPPLARMPCS